MSMRIAILSAMSIIFIPLTALSATTPNTVPNADLLMKKREGAVDEMKKNSAQNIFDSAASKNDPTANSKIPENVLTKLDHAVSVGAYVEIANFIRKYKEDPKLFDWVQTRAKQGNVMLMWELADLHAQSNSIELAINWAYAALIGTLQERALCLDPHVEFAAEKIASMHARTVNLRRANPFLTKDAKKFAIDALMNAKNPPHPEPWLCKTYADPNHAKSQPYSYHPAYFSYLRARERNKIRINLQIESPAETLPALPEKITTANPPTTPSLKP